MEVEDNFRARQLRHERAEHEVVGHRVHLHGAQSMPQVQPYECQRCEKKESVVFVRVAQDLSPLVPHRQPVHLNAVDRFASFLTAVTQTYDARLVARALKRIGLAFHFELVGVVVAMADERDALSLPPACDHVVIHAEQCLRVHFERIAPHLAARVDALRSQQCGVQRLRDSVDVTADHMATRYIGKNRRNVAYRRRHHRGCYTRALHAMVTGDASRADAHENDVGGVYMVRNFRVRDLVQRDKFNIASVGPKLAQSLDRAPR